MLGKQGIIEAHEAEKIIGGLQAILADIEGGRVEFLSLIHIYVIAASCRRQCAPDSLKSRRTQLRPPAF